MPPPGPTLRNAFDALVGAFDERRVRYAIVGGLAIIQHTRVRTRDDPRRLKLSEWLRKANPPA